MLYKYSTVEMMVRLEGTQHYDMVEKGTAAAVRTTRPDFNWVFRFTFLVYEHLTLVQIASEHSTWWVKVKQTGRSL